MNNVIGKNVIYNNKQYTIENTMHFVDKNVRRYYLKDSDGSIIVDDDADNPTNIKLLDSQNNNIINMDDIIEYNEGKYVVSAKMTMPFDSSKTMYGLTNLNTKEIVKVYDENEIQKFVKIVQ